VYVTTAKKSNAPDTNQTDSVSCCVDAHMFASPLPPADRRPVRGRPDATADTVGGCTGAASASGSGKKVIAPVLEGKKRLCFYTAEDDTSTGQFLKNSARPGWDATVGKTQPREWDRRVAGHAHDPRPSV